MEYILTYKDYNDSLKRSKLLGLKCKSCGAITVPPKMVCHTCTSPDLEITELAGKGEIVTFTTNNVAAEGREVEVPYTIVMVQLEEGPWLMGNLTGVDPGQVTIDVIGKKVRMSQSKVFPGDKFSAGDGARANFVIE